MDHVSIVVIDFWPIFAQFYQKNVLLCNRSKRKRNFNVSEIGVTLKPLFTLARFCYCLGNAEYYNEHNRPSKKWTGTRLYWPLYAHFISRFISPAGKLPVQEIA